MARRDKPCTKEEFSHAHLISDDYKHVVIDGIEMTAENIWNLQGDRAALVEKLVDYFYNEGFVPYIEETDDEIIDDMKKLKDADASSVVDDKGFVKNTSRVGLDVCRVFCMESFYSTHVNGTPSIIDVFKSKDLLRKVLKNRLGWYTTTEPLEIDGKKVAGTWPYLFDISSKMIVQGARSSMTSANVSNFRPLVAKHLMQRYCNEGSKVLDLSAGWCARFLAAWSLDKQYFGIDPMTARDLKKLQAFMNSHEKTSSASSKSSVILEGVSEDASLYASIPEVDYVIACPPYFKLEEYPCDGNSTDVYPAYEDWLEKYWRATVKNAVSKMKKGAKFSLIMIEKWTKFDLLADMTKIMKEEGLAFFEELSYKTTRSHLTDKRKSGNTSKSSEKIATFIR